MAAPSTAPVKKAKAAPKTAKPKVEKKAPSHPSSNAMVIEAITKLGQKGGSSLQAIKKYIADVHKVDIEKQAKNIRKALVKAVEDGKLTQPRGKGAAGSFKLAVKAKEPAAKKPATALKPKRDIEVKAPRKQIVTKSARKAAPKARAPKPAKMASTKKVVPKKAAPRRAEKVAA